MIAAMLEENVKAVVYHWTGVTGWLGWRLCWRHPLSQHGRLNE